MLERPRLLPQEPSYSDPEARIAFLSGALPQLQVVVFTDVAQVRESHYLLRLQV
jgi:hypothetical protein